MAVTDIQATVSNLTGVSPSANTVEDAQRFVVSSVPKNLLKWAATFTVPGNHGGNTSDGVKITMPIGTDSILDVSRNGFSGTEVPYNMKGFIANTASLYLATNTYPKYYLDDANPGEGVRIIVKPIPTDSETAIALYVDFSKIDDDCDLRNAVIYKASSQEFEKLGSDELPTISISAVPPDVPSLSAISFSETNGLSITATAPTAISLATISYTDATNADASATAVGAITVATVGKADMDGNVPTYTKPSTTVTAVPPDVPTLATVSFSETNALSITASLPGTPSDPSISSPGISTVAKADISGDVPTYTKPGHPAQVSFSSYTSGLSETDPGTTVVTAVPPDSITDTITDFSLAGEFDDAMAKAKALIDTATMGGDTEPESAQFWLNDEDPEMVASTVQVASQELQRANLGLQDALQTFNTDMQKFQASGTGKFSAEVAAYQAEVGAQVQDYTQKLQQYQVELTTAYQAWAKTESDNLQVFQSDIQNELNEFNMENARYQANIQAEIAKFQVDAAEAQKEGDLEFQARIQDYTQELALFSGEIQKYQAEVNKEVQEYTTQLQSDIQTMQGTVANNQALLTKYQTEITEYQAEVATEMQVIGADIQNELNEFNKENVRYQANVQAELAKHNTDLQKASTQAQIDAADAQQEAAQTTDVDKFNKAQDQALDLANRSKQIEDDISNNNSKVAQFQAEAQHYATQVNEDVQAYTSQLQIDVQQMQGDVVTEQNKLAKYQAELVEYQAEVAAETVEYQNKIQKQQVYSKESDKYYQWANAEVQMYIQNNSKMISRNIAAQAATQQQRAD